MEIRAIEPFLDYYAKIRERTRRVVVLIPPDRLEWAPREGAWSFGDLVRHLAAIERWMFAENVSGRPSRYPGHGKELADGYGAVLAYFDGMHEEAMELFRALAPDALQARCTTPGGASMPAWKWLRAMVEHEIHHRGQLYLMLGMIGVPTPPLYGLTSEEVKARSAAA
ncbi:MAG TPA: DinB family protein [Longimicrobium sp.]